MLLRIYLQFTIPLSHCGMNNNVSPKMKNKENSYQLAKSIIDCQWYFNNKVTFLEGLRSQFIISKY